MAKKGELTEKKRSILEALATSRYRFVSPTVIGKRCGKPQYMASSWACKALDALVESGLVMRNENGHYQITFIGMDEIKKGDRNG